MKIILFITLIFSFLVMSCKQTIQQEKIEEKPKTSSIESRITEIKQIYSEFLSVESASKSKDCQDHQYKEEHSIAEDLPPIEHEQSVSFCNISNEFSYYKETFNGYEWQDNLTVYLKDGKIFFALLVVMAESCVNEYRYYFDEDENVIKMLDKHNDCDGLKEPTIVVEVTKQEDKTMVLNYFTESLARVKEKLKK